MSSRLSCVLGSNGPSWDTKLEFAEKDADRIGKCLVDQCGFTVYRNPQNGDALDATREVLRVAALCRPGDDFIVYFSGHGVLHAGRLYLLWHTTAETIFDSAISAKQIIEALELSAATHKLLILDCCHAGGAVGFKSDGALQPVLTDGGSQLVLCASNKLELAREFREYEGSFLSFHIATILESKTKSLISLVELVDQLKKRATENNSANPRKRVPEPYLFGEAKSPFIVKRPKGKQPVEIKALSLFQPDMDLFRATVGPYCRWQSTFVLNSLPVEITFPMELVDRVKVLDGYLKTDQWPCEVEQRTKDQVRFTVEQLLPELKEELILAVRMVVAAAFSEDGKNLEAARDSVLDAYISGKLFAAARFFNYMWLHGEPRDAWTDQFNELQLQADYSLMYGLTWTSQSHYSCNFWTDADWNYGGDRCRVYIPQKFGEGLDELRCFSRENFWRLIVPQFVEAKVSQSRRFGTFELTVAMKREPEDLLSYLVLRGESIIETQSHNSTIYTFDAKRHATLVVAQELATYLKSLEQPKRDRAYFRITTGNVLDDLALEVQELLPELRPHHTPVDNMQEPN